MSICPMIKYMIANNECNWYTGGSHLSQIFWEHGNLSGLRVIWLIQSYFIGLNRKVALAKNLA